MQRTYYEKLLADERLGLAGILDSDIAELKASGCLEQPMENATLIDCRSRYIKAMMQKVEQDIASVMTIEQFARYRVSPAFRELLVQKATQQYWTYEAFLFLRAHGARTVNVGAQASIELLSMPLETDCRNFRMEVPAQMLVFESPEMVEAFYAGDRRATGGRYRPDAAVCVLAVEMLTEDDARARSLKLLSVHGDTAQDYRVEIRKLVLVPDRSLEDVLENDDANAWHGGEQIARMMGLPTGTLAWAARKADCGYAAAKTAYYRALLGALHYARTEPRRLAWRPGALGEAGGSRLQYAELLPSGYRDN
jgi:hypothetical protein